MINVQVERNQNESGLSLLRRFTKRVQGSGVLPRVRSIRYASRNVSEAVKHKKTMKKLARKVEIAEQIKLGKIPENGRTNNRKRR